MSQGELTSIPKHCFVAKQLNKTLFCRNTSKYGIFCRKVLRYALRAKKMAASGLRADSTLFPTLVSTAPILLLKVFHNYSCQLSQNLCGVDNPLNIPDNPNILVEKSSFEPYLPNSEYRKISWGRKIQFPNFVSSHFGLGGWEVALDKLNFLVAPYLANSLLGEICLDLRVNFLCVIALLTYMADNLFWEESSSDDLGKVYQTDHPQKSDSLSNTNHSSHMTFNFQKSTRFKRAGGNLQGYYSEILGVLFQLKVFPLRVHFFHFFAVPSEIEMKSQDFNLSPKIYFAYDKKEWELESEMGK